MPDQPLQNSLFEDDYLLRELGQVAHVAQVALTELVANAWDAGATRVDLILPSEIGGTLTVTDDGHGMASTQFRKRWMTLRYDRLKHQAPTSSFRPGAMHARAGPMVATGSGGMACSASPTSTRCRRGATARRAAGNRREERRAPHRRLSQSAYTYRHPLRDRPLAAKLALHTGATRPVVVIEGVFMYLEPAAIESTLRAVRQVFPHHLLLCDLMNRRFFDKFAYRLHEKIVGAGASFTRRPDHPAAVFLEHGYRLTARIPMIARAVEVGVLQERTRIPGFLARLMPRVVKDMNGYAVHCFQV